MLMDKEMEKESDLFVTEHWNFSMRAVYSVGCYVDRPYVNHCPSDLENDTIKGHLGQTFEILMLALTHISGQSSIINHTYFYNASNYGRYADGKWEGLVGQLISYATDVTLPDIALTSHRFQYVDYVFPIIHHMETFLINPVISDKRPPIFEPFTFLVWMLWAGLLIVLSMLIALIKYKKREDKTEDLMAYVDAVYAVLFQKRMRNKWVLPEVKILVTVWSFAAVLGLCLYSAIFLKRFWPKSKELPFQNIDQLAYLVKHKKYQLLVLGGSLWHDRILPESNEAHYTSLRKALINNYDQLLVANSSLERDHTIRTRPGTVLATLDAVAAEAIRKYPNLMALEDSMAMLGAFAIRKKNPMKQPLQNALYSIMESGIELHLRKVYGMVPISSSTENDRTEPNPLGVSQVGPCFLVLQWGYIAAILALFIEYLTVRILAAKTLEDFVRNVFYLPPPLKHHLQRVKNLSNKLVKK